MSGCVEDTDAGLGTASSEVWREQAPAKLLVSERGVFRFSGCEGLAKGPAVAPMVDRSCGKARVAQPWGLDSVRLQDDVWSCLILDA
jgi:hypothetical protein